MSTFSNEPLLNKEQLDVLTSLSEDDPKAFLADLFNTFQQSWPEISKIIQAGAQAKNNEDLRKGVHKLNGSAANIGLNRLCLICRDIEGKIYEKKFEDYDNCFSMISSEYQSSISELQKFMNSL